MYDQVFNNECDFISFFSKEENDTAENREAILQTPRLRYWYCRYIRDVKGVRVGITASEYAYLYCKYVSDRAEISKNITEADWALELNTWRARHREGPMEGAIRDYYNAYTR